MLFWWRGFLLKDTRDKHFFDERNDKRLHIKILYHSNDSNPDRVKRCDPLARLWLLSCRTLFCSVWNSSKIVVMRSFSSSSSILMKNIQFKVFGKQNLVFLLGFLIWQFTRMIIWGINWYPIFQNILRKQLGK